MAVLDIFDSYFNLTIARNITFREIVLAIVAVYTISIVVQGIRRVWFHPLSKYPGPRLAALTLWWQCYYDVFLNGGGQLLAQLKPLHEKYGPVVRIGPNHLHFSEPSAYHDIYCQGSTFHKDPNFYKLFFIDESSFGSVDRRLAKTRRDALLPFFSRRALTKLESAIQEKVDHLIDELKTYDNEPVNMHMAYRSATLDIIMEYLFARCYDAISARHFRNSTIVSLQESLSTLFVLKHFPLVFTILKILPDWLVNKLDSSAKGFIRIVHTCETHANEVLSNPEEKLHNASHEIVYHHLVTPDPAKRSEMPTKKRLSNEASSLLNAGSDTVGGTCTTGTFYVLNDERILRRLRTELDEARKERGMGVKESLGFEVLEKLPYLTAVIKESLRLAHGVVTPLPRVVGPEDSIVGGYKVPKGSVVAISSAFIHNDPVLFPDPFKFNPERWLQGPESRALERWLVPFSTGPRQCLGMNLAWSELYLFFGNVFAQLDMRVHDTTVEDMNDFKEFFLPAFSKKQLHCYVKARGD